MENRASYLGHATVLIELGGARLLTDPLLRRRIGPLGRRSPPPSASALGSLDAVLISHPHRDHLDLPSLRSLDSGTHVIAPRGSRRLIERTGLRRVTEVGAGDEVEVGGATITAVPAVHGGPRTPFVAPPSGSVGYLIQGAARVYFAGDTELFPAMAELAPLDLALLPIWGWGPTLGPGHMDPKQAAEALSLLGARMAVPIHWGTIHPIGLGWLAPRWLTRPAAQFNRHAAQIAPDVDVRILEPGDSLPLAPGDAA